MATEDNITIPRHIYDQLRRDQIMLRALESAGVDNWDGFDYAFTLYGEDIEAEGL